MWYFWAVVVGVPVLVKLGTLSNEDGEADDDGKKQ